MASASSGTWITGMSAARLVGVTRQALILATLRGALRAKHTPHGRLYRLEDVAHYAQGRAARRTRSKEGAR
jgi:hypothetical protein